MKKSSGQNRKGFTLLELIIVVAVIAILASVAFPSYMSLAMMTIAVVVNGV